MAFFRTLLAGSLRGPSGETLRLSGDGMQSSNEVIEGDVPGLSIWGVPALETARSLRGEGNAGTSGSHGGARTGASGNPTTPSVGAVDIAAMIELALAEVSFSAFDFGW